MHNDKYAPHNLTSKVNLVSSQGRLTTNPSVIGQYTLTRGSVWTYAGDLSDIHSTYMCGPDLAFLHVDDMTNGDWFSVEEASIVPPPLPKADPKPVKVELAEKATTTRSSIGNFLKSLVNAEAMGDEVIRLQVDTYNFMKAKHPDYEPHQLLALVWLSRMQALGKNVQSELMQQQAYTETLQYACLPPTSNARALGLWFIYKERPDILDRYPKFAFAYESLLSPIMEAMQTGNLMVFYGRYNPKAAKAMTSDQDAYDLSPA